MKSIPNTLPPFPKVGDVITPTTKQTCFSNSSGREGTLWNVLEIRPCSRRCNCRQDDFCSYCLTLQQIGDSIRMRPGHHAWNNPKGEPYWKIIEEE